MIINIKKLDPDAKVPTYGTAGAACFDLYSVNDGHVGYHHPGAFGTGLAFEIPQNHVMLIFSRSGDGFKHGVRLSNCTGVIDSDYRGEVQVKLASDKEGKFVKAGDRIAQAMVLPVETVFFKEVEELSDTDRGVGGFGSTGVL